MKWLQFSGQYINTGIAPQAGYKISTTLRFSQNPMITPLFGSRNSSSANSSSFNMFHMYDSAGYRLRADYGGAGSETALPFDMSNYTFGDKQTFNIDFGKITTVNGTEYTSPTNTVGSAFPIFIGSINNGGSADARRAVVDFAEFIIYNENGTKVFHGMPVEQGSTEYLPTPAPSHCLFDLVSQTYKVKSGGNGVLWFDDDDSDLTERDIATAQSADYGMKVLAEDNESIAYMNSKYPLFGSDISSQESQFKTFEFTVTGINNEPNPTFPAYIYDSNFYSGQGTIDRTALTIDTGLKGGKIKSITINHSGIQNANFQARARQRTRYTFDGTNINSLLNPSSKSVGELNIGSTLYIVDGGVTGLGILQALGASAEWNTLSGFNGGVVQSFYPTTPYISMDLDDDGILKVKTTVPYRWIQRAFNISGNVYEARWLDWCWYQGVTATVTILNTPYEL